MNGTEFIGRGSDHLGIIRTKLADLQGYAALANELIQNADDAPQSTSMWFDVRHDSLIVDNDGVFSDCGAVKNPHCSWREDETKNYMCDFHRFRTVASGDKRGQEGTTGAFGIGFIATYQVCDHPEVISANKHWILFDDNEESQRITSCSGCERCKNDSLPNTRFILPWASDASSSLRKILGVEAITEDRKKELLAELLEYVPSAMLFLKKLTKIEIKENGKLVKSFERLVEGDTILISNGDAKQDHIWYLFHGNFKNEAQKLRAEYSDRIESKRSDKVTIAIPSTRFENGVFCAILPTQQYTGLPFHINADFYPKSDRKGIVLDQDYRSSWNRSAIKASAQLLSDNLESLAKKVGHVQVWEIIQATSRVIDEVETGRLDTSLNYFWLAVTKDIASKKVFYNTKNDWVIAHKVCYLYENDEEEALHIFSDLGISIVHEDLRQFRNLFRRTEISIKPLDIFLALERLHSIRMQERIEGEKIPECLRADQARGIFWREILKLWKRVKKDEKDKCDTMLAACAIAPDMDGGFCLCEDAYWTDNETIALFRKWGREIRFIDNKYSDFTPLRELCCKFTVLAGIDSIKKLLSHTKPEVDQLTIFNWLDARRDEILSDVDTKREVASLPIYPTKNGFKPLKSLTLPGGFSDPIGISDILEISLLGGRPEFIQGLGVTSLTFDIYVKDFVPKAMQGSSLGTDQKKELVILLAGRLGEIRDNKDILAKLQRLEIVECCDHEWYEPTEVYFKTDSVVAILGSSLHFASLTGTHQLAQREFFHWLGVSDEPRENDIIENVKTLRGAIPNEVNSSMVYAIIKFYAGKHRRGEQIDRAMNVFKETSWLPAQDDTTKYFRASDLFATFRQYLFSSTHVHFIDIDRKIENENIDFLVDCGLQKDPNIRLVLQHLQNCVSQNDITMNREVYSYLNNYASDKSIDVLKGKRCLLLGKTFVSPQKVFWFQHQLGSYRYVLGEEFKKYWNLLDRLGVRNYPNCIDAKEVLLEIALEHETDPIVDEGTNEIVLNCWRLIETALLAETVDTKDLIELSSLKVICNQQRMLNQPQQMFFDDRAGLSQKFGGRLLQFVTSQIGGAWRAMEASGVRPLSRATQIVLVERRDPTSDDIVRSTIVSRINELIRVLGTAVIDHNAVTSIVDRLQAITVISAAELKGKYVINLLDKTIESSIENLPAAYLPEENELSYCKKDSIVPWPAIARELSANLCPDVEPGRLASALKDVLSALDIVSANRLLDELGFPPPVSTPTCSSQIGTTITGFGGTETVPGAEPTPTTQPTIPIPPTPPPPPTTGVKGAIETILGGNVPPPNPPPEGLGKGEYAPGGDTKGTEPPKKWIGKVKVRSYFSGGGGTQEGDPDDYRERSATDKAGIEKVVAYEISCGLQPEVKPHTHPGYDIESRNADGSIERYIEVKSLSRDWDSLNAEMTKTQFNKAIEIGDKFWLYVVENAQTDDAEINRIQDPARLVLKYAYDGGWKDFVNQ